MESKIRIHDMSLSFRIYHDKSLSLKDRFTSLFGASQDAYSEFYALRDICVSIGNGEKVGIIGPNGSGKSTLLKTICNIYKPCEGSVEVAGRVAPLLEIGAGFNPAFTGRENIYFNGAILGFSKSKIRSLEEEIIEFSELSEFIDTPVKYYSTGMYMRLAFSIATSVTPDILVLDEIFAGGDLHFVEKAKNRMTECINNANIVIMVSHQLDLISELCSRSILLDQGRVIMDGDPSGVTKKYRNI